MVLVTKASVFVSRDGLVISVINCRAIRDVQSMVNARTGLVFARRDGTGNTVLYVSFSL